MDSVAPHSFRKEERLCSRKAIEELFGGGHKSLSAYPIRAVFRHNGTATTRILVSVSKRYFKRAVKRNRIKRQIREAYRLQKETLLPLEDGLDIAFLWTSGEEQPTEAVFLKVQNILQRIHETLADKQIKQQDIGNKTTD